MKIAYLSTFYPFRGGIAQFNAALYRQLTKEHNVQAYTFKRQYPDFLFPGTSQYVTKDDIADKIPAERVLDTINPVTYLSSASKISTFKPNMMLTKFWLPFFGPSLGYVAGKLKKRGTINISILDNVLPHENRPGDLQFTKYFLKKNHGFMVMSNTVLDDLLKFIPDARFTMIPHPLYDHFGKKTDKTEAREKLGIPKEKKVLLFFGFIRSYKGLDLLMEAVQSMPDDYLLLVAGEVYGSFDTYEKQIKELKIESKVKLMVRYISDNEVPDIFSASDVCILPYKTATQSGIIGIAYHFDLPVIATDTGGLKEMISPFGTGLIVDSAQPNLIASAVSDYFRFDMREDFENNIKSYKSIASWENLANSIIELYEEIKLRL